jgi:hypothetical protein
MPADAPVEMRPWERPYWWWGDPWAPASTMSLEDLVGAAVLTAGQSRDLIRRVTAGGSVVIAAAESGAGKSTVARALIDCLPPERHRIYIRGNHEPFDWVDLIPPEQGTLLVNEFSPHLPTYCWGDTARRVLDLVRSGYQLIATTHAATADEAAKTLASQSSLTAPEIGSLADILILAPVDLLGLHRLTDGGESLRGIPALRPTCRYDQDCGRRLDVTPRAG